MFASFDVNLTAAQLRDANAPKAAFDTQFFPAAFSAVASSPAAAMASFLQAIPRMTPACNPAHLHPVLTTEARAI